MDRFKFLLNWLGPFEVLGECADSHLLTRARWLVFGIWIWDIVNQPLWLVGYLPSASYRPTGVLAFVSPSEINQLFEVNNLYSIEIVCLISCIVTFLPFGFQLTSLIASILLTLFETIIHGKCEISHHEIILLFSSWTLSLLSVRDAVKRWFIGGREVSASSALFTIPAIFLTCYSLVGINRLFVGGYRLFTDESIHAWVVMKSMEGFYNDGLGWRLMTNPWIKEFMIISFPIVTLFEVLSPLALIWPKFRWIYLVFLLSFHLLCREFMDVVFGENIILSLFLIDWSRVPKPGMVCLYKRLFPPHLRRLMAYLGISFSS